MRQGFSICALIILGVMGSCSFQHPPQVQQGKLDLRQWSWEEDGHLPLDGMWEFHWQEFISPQHSQLAISEPLSFTHVPGTWIEHEVRWRVITGDRVHLIPFTSTAPG